MLKIIFSIILFGSFFLDNAFAIGNIPSNVTTLPLSTTSIKVTWTDPSGQEIGFALQRSSNATFTSNVVTISSTIPANTTSYTVTGLTTSTTYYFRVRAKYSYGNSSYSTAVSGTTLSATTIQSIKTAVILVNFQSYQVQPFSVSDQRNMTFLDMTSGSGTNGFYKSASHQKIQLTGVLNSTQGDVFGWYTIPNPPFICSLHTREEFGKYVNQQVLPLAQLNGFVESAYDKVQVMMALNNYTCMGGWAQFNGKYIWSITTLSPPLSTAAIAGLGQVKLHELGHNFGLEHANSLYCTQNGVQVPISSSCNSYEYGDVFSGMGNNSRHFSNLHMEQLGWLASNRIQTIGSGISDQVLQLTSIEQPVSSGIQLIKIYRRLGEYFYLEYRQPFGAYDTFSLTDPVTQGISVRLNSYNGLWTSKSRSHLIHMNPQLGSYTQSPLLPGQSFFDAISGVRISVQSAGSSNQIPVRVEVLPVTCTSSIAPKVEIKLPLGAKYFSIGTPYLDIPFEVTNGNPSGCVGYNTFTLSSVVGSGFTGQFLVNNSITILPGQKYQGTFRLTPNSGNTTSTVRQITIKATDSTAPSIAGFGYKDIDYQPSTCIRSAPTITSNQTISQVTIANPITTATYTITNQDSATCMNRNITLSSHGIFGFETTPSSEQIILSPGQSTTKTYQWNWAASLPVSSRVSSGYLGIKKLVDTINYTDLTSYDLSPHTSMVINVNP